MIPAQFDSIGPGRAEAPCAPLGLVESLALLQLGVLDLLADELRDAIPLLDLELALGMVEEHDAHVARVVLVHDPSPHVDVVLGRQPGPGRDSAVGPLGDADLDVRLGDHLARGRDHVVVGGAEVVAGSAGRT